MKGEREGASENARNRAWDCVREDAGKAPQRRQRERAGQDSEVDFRIIFRGLFPIAEGEGEKENVEIWEIFSEIKVQPLEIKLPIRHNVNYWRTVAIRLFIPGYF